MAECMTCGSEFQPRSDGGKPQKFCGRRCRNLAANRASRERNRPVRSAVCVECGGPVVQSMETGRPRRFCSDSCKQRAHNRAKRRRLLPAPKQPERACIYCGKMFAPKRRDQVYCPLGPGSYCVQEAYRARKAAGEPLRQVEQVKVCVECGSEFATRSPLAKFCSSICRGRKRGRDASRRRGAGLGAVPYTDREIFERDGWRCYLCGRPVKRTAARTDPAGATIDHVVPLSSGGVDAPSNVATAHWRCNHAKRGQPVDYQLLLVNA